MAFQFSKTWSQLAALIEGAMQKGVDYVTAGRMTGTTLGTNATAEGENNTVSAAYGHVEGYGNTLAAGGTYGHIEGQGNTVSGADAHAGGANSTASGAMSFAHGYYSVASAQEAVAFGEQSEASGKAAFTAGRQTTAHGAQSAAFGNGTTANGSSQMAFGKYNIPDTTSLEIVGNGSSSTPSNARTLDAAGNETLAGKLTIGVRGSEDMDVATLADAYAAYVTETESGDIVTITDGADGIPVKSFVGSIVPQQNLNGYDNPWPAGGGKNKLPLPSAATVNGVTLAVNTDGSITLTGTASSTATFDFVAAGNFDSTAYAGYVFSGGANFAGSSNGYSVRVVDGGNVLQTITANETAIVDNGSGRRLMLRVGSGTAFPSGGLTLYPMLRASGTDNTFAPYSNVCPISGWSEAEIYHRGKNLFNINATFIKNSANYSVSGDVLTVTSTVNSSASIRGLIMPIFADMVGKSIALSGTIGGTTPQQNKFRLRVYNDAEINSFFADFTSTAGASVGTVTAAMVGKYLAIVFYAPTTSGQSTTYTGVQVEFSDSATDYDAYQGETIILTFGSTVYAGTITALGGGKYAIQPTHQVVDPSPLTWGYYNDGRAYATIPTPSINSVQGEAVAPMWAEQYKPHYTSSPSDLLLNEYCVDTGGTRINARTQPIGTMGTKPVGLFVLPIAVASRPDPIIVSGDDLATLLGANTVWTDVGAVTELEYRADTALYIAKLLGNGTRTLAAAPLNRTSVLLETPTEEVETTTDAVETPTEGGEDDE